MTPCRSLEVVERGVLVELIALPLLWFCLRLVASIYIETNSIAVLIKHKYIKGHNG